MPKVETVRYASTNPQKAARESGWKLGEVAIYNLRRRAEWDNGRGGNRAPALSITLRELEASFQYGEAMPQAGKAQKPSAENAVYAGKRPLFDIEKRLTGEIVEIDLRQLERLGGEVGNLASKALGRLDEAMPLELDKVSKAMLVIGERFGTEKLYRAIKELGRALARAEMSLASEAEADERMLRKRRAAEHLMQIALFAKRSE